MESNFIDYVKIMFRSGKGGSGSIHFRREKFIPKGGPDGGDGGKGGDIILRGNSQLWTLLHLKYKRHIFAENGKPGKGANKTGADGKGITVEVPLGTVVKDFETNKILFEITEHNQKKNLYKGGKGGLGNNRFKSATQQTPRYAQPGQESKEGLIILELKILADVGLVGFPNAGKSTLLSVITAAKPKIANYPFTTLVPNLGMVHFKDDKSFVMADIPGIIEGAHKGKGLGTRFLRHIERNATLLFMIPADSENITEEYHILLKELSLYNPELLHKSRLLAITKMDLLSNSEKEKLTAKLPNVPYVLISSLTNEGLDELKNLLWKTLTHKSYQELSYSTK